MSTRLPSRGRMAVFIALLGVALIGASFHAGPAFAGTGSNTGCVFNDFNLTGRSVWMSTSINTDTRTVGATVGSYSSATPCQIYMPSNGGTIWMQVYYDDGHSGTRVCDTKGSYTQTIPTVTYIQQQTFNYCGPGRYYVYACGGVLWGIWKIGCLTSSDAYG